MVCPRCTAEIEEGATECPNCGVELGPDSDEAYQIVPGDADKELAEGKLVEVWSAEDEGNCVQKCKKLRKAGIPFKVSQHRYGGGREIFTGYFKDAGYYKIGVPPEFVEDAKKLIGPEEKDEAEADKDISGDEIPAEPEPQTGIDAGEEGDYESKDDGKESMVEIWSGDGEVADGIEMALKENGIRARVDSGEKGKRKVSVASEHHERAKEIVKEIEEGRPE